MKVLSILQSLAGMGNMTEKVIATDFLISAKASVRNYAIAISETTTPEVREVLRMHLDASIITHEKILRFMMDNGYYHVNNPKEQINEDMANADIALKLPN